MQNKPTKNHKATRQWLSTNYLITKANNANHGKNNLLLYFCCYDYAKLRPKTKINTTYSKMSRNLLTI